MTRESAGSFAFPQVSGLGEENTRRAGAPPRTGDNGVATAWLPEGDATMHRLSAGRPQETPCG